MNIIYSLLQISEAGEFFQRLFDTDDFMARWQCGKWTGFHGWVYIISDLMIFAAYFTIPALLFYFLRNKEKVPFKGVAVLFILFILFCGSTHLVDAIIFWWPAYRFNGILLICTAIISWITVAALIKVLPIAFTMKTTDELEVIVNSKTAELIEQKENLEDFAQIVSHDLRSPIASLTSLMELHDLKKNPEDKEKVVEKFKEVLLGMNNSIDNMSEVVNWQLGTVQSEKLDIVEIFNNVKVSLQSHIKESNAEINSNFKGSTNFTYPKIYMESIFLNLLSNSIKYRKPDTPCIININVTKRKHILKMVFEDNGLGIDLEKYGHKVFALNQTLHNHENSRGIGLYLVRKHIIQMGGKIEVVSKPNEGTTFTISLNDQS